MLFEKSLIPHEMYAHFYDLTPEHLESLGIKFVFSDIDNTLATYDDPTPPEKVTEWYRSMTEAGVTVVFVSNNGHDRVSSFASPLGAKAYARAKKPLTATLRRAMSDAGATRENSLLLGDQLLTDAAAGLRVGMRVAIVPPIKDKKNLFFRFKRVLEKPYVAKFFRENNPDFEYEIN